MLAPGQNTSTKVDPFYVFNHCRLHVCPGDLKHPAESGYAYSELYAKDIFPLLEAGEAHRYCWLLNDEHLVLDVDMHEGGANGLQSLADLSREIGVDLRAVCRAVVRTPTGGLHLCWRKPADLRIRSLKTMGWEGIDTLSRSVRNNALVIAAGSTHPDVEQYRYQWDLGGKAPVLEEAPSELLAYLENNDPIQGPVKPGQESDGRPGTEFMRSWEGVEHLAALLSEKDYLFRSTADDMGVPFYEYRRGGQTSGAQRSGYLGKVNSHGSYQWTSFSHADDYLEEQETVNIFEGLRRVLSGGRAVEPAEGEDPWAAAMSWIDERGFKGDVFAGLDVSAGDGSGDGSGGMAEGTWGNYHEEKRGKKTVKVGFTLNELVEPWVRRGLLRKFAGQLFACEGGEVRIISGTDDLFAWISLHVQVVWSDVAWGAVTRGQFYRGLLAAVEEVASIENVPHFPAVEGCFYPRPVEVGNEQDLWDYVDHFSPASEEDRKLIAAMIATVFWGGVGGQRPVFTITSEGGVGSGKTTLVQAVARLVTGGSATLHRISKPKHFDDLEESIGHKESRIISIDNFRGAKIGGTDLEAWITDKIAHGRKLYVGQFTVPNMFTWMVTGNHVEMTDDLAARVVQIKLRKPDAYSADWNEKLEAWDLDKVVRGVAALFDREPAAWGDDEVTRFPSWCREILGRLDGGSDLVTRIWRDNERLSTESEEAEELEYWIQSFLQGTPALPDGTYEFTGTSLSEWLNRERKPYPGSGNWSGQKAGQYVSRYLDRIPALTTSRSGGRKRYTWNPAAVGAQGASTGGTP